MKIPITSDKAIEILECYLRGDEPDQQADLADSIRLGKEALIRHEKMKTILSHWLYTLLPGETKE